MEKLWVLWALLAAFMVATSDALTKKALVVHNEYHMAWLRLLFALPFLAAWLFVIPIPTLDWTFFAAGLMALPLEIVAIILYVKALKYSPLSLSMPFLSLTPIFLIVIPYVLMGEKISMIGGLGVFFIAAGGYALNIKDVHMGVLQPFMAIRKEKGSVFMIIVALIYSVTSTLGKIGVEHSSPIFFGMVYYMAFVVVLTPIILLKSGCGLRELFGGSAVRAAIIPGICYSVVVISHMTAISLTKVAYMVSVKRLSLVIAVLYGYLFFKESHIRERLIGTILMVAGFALILIFH
jgi:drug/metabolite transporter (DMT)-like permease